jgi:hypothetical protein
MLTDADTSSAPPRTRVNLGLSRILPESGSLPGLGKVGYSVVPVVAPPGGLVWVGFPL